jgi:hypothetical protein
VQQHDVAVGELLRERLRVRLGDALEQRVLVGAERPAVALGAVQAVVDALGQREERRVALDRHPAGVDVRGAHVADQRAQHLRNAPAPRGGVDRPQHAPAQHLLAARDRLFEIGAAVRRQDGAVALQVQGGDVDLVQRHGGGD